MKKLVHMTTVVVLVGMSEVSNGIVYFGSPERGRA
jgi:hypothetical protein